MAIGWCLQSLSLLGSCPWGRVGAWALCWGEGKKGYSPGSVRGSSSCLITPTCGPSLRDQLPGAHKQGPVVGQGIFMESPSIPEPGGGEAIFPSRNGPAHSAASL